MAAGAGGAGRDKTWAHHKHKVFAELSVAICDLTPEEATERRGKYTTISSFVFAS